MAPATVDCVLATQHALAQQLESWEQRSEVRWKELRLLLEIATKRPVLGVDQNDGIGPGGPSSQLSTNSGTVSASTQDDWQEEVMLDAARSMRSQLRQSLGVAPNAGRFDGNSKVVRISSIGSVILEKVPEVQKDEVMPERTLFDEGEAPARFVCNPNSEGSIHASAKQNFLQHDTPVSGDKTKKYTDQDLSPSSFVLQGLESNDDILDGVEVGLAQTAQGEAVHRADECARTVYVPPGTPLSDFSGSVKRSSNTASDVTKRSAFTSSSAEEFEGEEADVSFCWLFVLDVVPAVAIAINAVVLGFEADASLMGIEDSPIFFGLEVFFFVFFWLELLVKVKLSGPSDFFLGQNWYWGWFDLASVVVSGIEISQNLFPNSLQSSPFGQGGMIKLLKLLRLGRVIRLLKFKVFAELKSMLMGVFTGIRVFAWAVVLLLILVYLTGVVGRMMYGDIIEEFHSVPAAMFTMFRCYTDGCAAYDGTPLTERLRGKQSFMEKRGIETMPIPGGIFIMLWILSFLFVTIGIFNLIMAVFIDHVNEGGAKKRQYMLGLSAGMTELMLAETFQELCQQESRKRPSLRERMSTISTGLRQRLAELQEPARAGLTNRKECARKVDIIRQDMEIHNVNIERDTFQRWLRKNDLPAVVALGNADIDISMKFDLFDILDTDLCGQLSFTEILDGLMQCRGPVSKVDIVAIRLKVRHLTRLVQEVHTIMTSQSAKVE